MRALSTLTLTLLSFLTATAAAQESSSPGKLPVKRVVLFKNGVGYFEHVGTVHGNESIAVSFTSGQLNDVLKSLTVLDLNGGRITGIAYGTAAPISRQMGDACGNLASKSSQADLLNTVRGSKVEVRNGSATYSGRLLGVEEKTRTIGTPAAQQAVDYLSVLTETGELRTVELSPLASVRLLEPGLSARLGRCLTLAATETNADVRNMLISTEGTGSRNLSVSYISEVPVWKSTYRLVLGREKKSLLQGWAIVDNVVGEDWNNVELSLVAGAPQSFIQDLSQPYFAQRPTIALPDTVSTTPQTYEGTLMTGSAQLSGTVRDPSGAAVTGAKIIVRNSSGVQVNQTSTDSRGHYEIPALPDGALQLEATAPGFMTSQVTGLDASGGRQFQQDVTLQLGSTAQTVQVNAETAEISTGGRNLGRGSQLGRQFVANQMMTPSAGLPSGGAVGGVIREKEAPAPAPNQWFKAPQTGALFDAARAQALGDLFEYKVKDPITILKNRSALAPIVQTEIEAEKVSIWNDSNNQVHKPQRAVWITNTSGLTLDGGAFSVLEDGTFAGEGIFDPIRPGEKRLISYATDLAVTVSSQNSTQLGHVTRVIVAKGTMTHRSELRESRTYTFRNEDTTPRVIVLEHPVRSGYALVGNLHPVEKTADWMRFKVNVEPKQTVNFKVEEARPNDYSVELTNITSDQVALFVNQHSIDSKIEAALRDILAQKDAIVALQSKAGDLDTEKQSIFDDQQRLRENIKALKGTPEEKPLLQRYTTQLNNQETRLAELDKQKADLDAKVDAANAALNATIGKLAFNVDL